MDRNELLKEKIMFRKDGIKSAFLNRLTYEKWDKQSPVYAFNTITDEIEKIEDIGRIKYLLTLPCSPLVSYYSNKQDIESYIWLKSIINQEIEDRITESFTEHFDSFVNYKDIALGDCNMFYTSN